MNCLSRLIASLTLGLMAAILMTPMALANNPSEFDGFVCAVSEQYEDASSPTGYDFTYFQEDLNDWYSAWGEAYGEGMEGYCGKESNPITNTLEKGDCTAEGKVLTEVSEVIADDVVLDDNNEIITVYKGLCCFEPVKDGSTVTECNDTRAIYTLDYDDCDKQALYCEARQWIISTTGTNIIKLYIKQIYIWGSGIVGFIAVVIIVASGIQISVSGVSGDITAAKQRILQSIGGLVLLFLSGIILYTVNPTFFS